MRPLGHAVAVRAIRQIVLDSLSSVTARYDFNLVSRWDDHLLGHVADDLIHHEHHGYAELFRKIEGLDRQVEAFLWRVGTERDDFVVAVGTPSCLHHVGLCRQGGQTSGWTAALHIDEDAGRFRHCGVADMFHHQREAGAGSYGECLRAAPDGSLQGDRRGQLVLHLNERSPNLRHTARETLNDLGGGCDGISRSEACSGRQRAFAACVISVEEVSAGEHSTRISFHAPPPHSLPPFWLGATSLATGNLWP